MDSAVACGSFSLKDFISLSLYLIAISFCGMSAVISLRLIVTQFEYFTAVAIH